MNDTFVEIYDAVAQVFTFELFRLGNSPITLATLAKFLFLAGLVILAESILRRIMLHRVLTRTHLDEGVRFAVARITGYVLLTLGFYLAFTFVGIDLSSLAVLAGAIGVEIGRAHV